MDHSKNKNLFDLNRRDFIKVAGMGAAAMTMPGLIRNAKAASLSGMNQENIETDVLVIGGGIAGVFAAIRAKEQGVDVTMVDKGTVGKSGLSPFFGHYAYFDPSGNGTKKQFVETVSKTGEYLVYRDYAEMWTEDSMDRYNELKSWGVKHDTRGSRPVILRDQVKKAGVRLAERVMIIDLLEEEGQVAGAVGFPMEEDKAIVIKAKAVVLCAGSGAFKTPGWPISSLTHDGSAMAYKAGAEISGKEFIDFHWTFRENPADAWSNIKSEFGAFHKLVFDPDNLYFNAPPVAMALQAHSGDVPLYMRPPPGLIRPKPPGSGEGGASPGGFRSPDMPCVGGATAGMAPHKCEGVFPNDNKCSSNVTGLFAAGDALCTDGATYSGGGGSSSSGSAVQGGRAGIHAAEFAKKTKVIGISSSQIATVKKNIFEPRSRAKGYSPEWVTQVLQGIMIPYYVLYIKKQDRLEAALANIGFLMDHFAPNLIAKDTHELRHVHETRNMLLNAEMRLKASLFRTESRGAHYREDYPEKDDKDWLAWVIISKEGDEMKLKKRPVPDEWKPGA